jgi:Cu+-exporting ATPase
MSTSVTFSTGDFGPRLSPVIAAATMSLSSMSVIGNALRLRWLQLG